MADKDKIITVEVTLTGVTPLLMNCLDEVTLENLRTKKTTPRNRDVSREVEAGAKLYRDEEGRIGIPTGNLMASLAEAGRDVVLSGRKKISTAKTTTLHGFFDIEQDFMPFPEACQGELGDEFPCGWVADVRRGVNPNGGEAVALCRPKFSSWSVTFICTIDTGIINEANVRTLMDQAGRFVGLCDFRPSKRGRFGRSEVTAWKVLSTSTKVKDAVTVSREVDELVGVGAGNPHAASSNGS
jgi:hypothetical protein